MSSKGALALILLSLLIVFAMPSALVAQGAGPYLAFVNSSGQLVVASGDGGYRWIVTNPGEYLNAALGYSWSPNARQVFFAVDAGTEISLRVADIASQSMAEIGRVAPPVSGGQWTPDSASLLLALGNRLVALPVTGGGLVDLVNAPANVGLRSPFDIGSERSHLPQARNIAPGGQFLFYGLGANNAVQSIGGAPVMLTGGDPTGQYNGLWADAAPLVAYTGMSGNSQLAVTNAATGATLTLDSGRTAPINPLVWRPGTLQLIYRDATNYVRIADVACLMSGCADNPLQTGRELLPASAVDVQTDGTWVYFMDAATVQAVPLSCVDTASCPTSAVRLGDSVAPQSLMDVSGTTLVYTAGGGYGGGEIRALDLTCLANPATCTPRPLLSNAASGAVAPNGAYVVVEGGGTLNSLRVADGQLSYLSDSNGGLLAKARWSS
jgi:hypothetical protein